MTRRAALGPLALVIGALLAACGGGGAPASTPEEKPTWAWASASTGDCWSVASAAGPDGSIAVVGGFHGTGVLAASEDEPTVLPGEDGSEIFVTRVTPAGDLLWGRAITGLGWTEASDVDVGPDGAVYVCGYFFGTLTLAAGEPEETHFSTADGEDGFVACYEADGRLRWARQIASASADEMHGVAALPDGAVVAVGLFAESLLLGAGEAGETTLEPTGYLEALTACFEPDGRLRWARASASVGYAGAWDAAVLSDGAVAVCGDFVGEATFGGGELLETTVVSIDGSSDMFVACYEPDGALRWARSEGGADEDYACETAADPDGGLRLTGMFAADATFGAGGAAARTLTAAGRHDGVLVAYDASGEMQWVRQMAGPQHDAALQPVVKPDGSTCVLGTFAGSVRLALGMPEELELTAPAAGDVEVVLARYDANGTLACAMALGGPGEDYAVGLVPQPDGTYILVGSFTDRLEVADESVLIGEIEKACAWFARIEDPETP